MILIEFNGLPGCGKSTVSKELLKLFQKSNIDCTTYYDAHEKFPHNATCVLYALKNWKSNEIKALLKISRCVANASVFNQINRIIMAEQICVNYRRFRDQSGVCIIDQGIIQAIASILYVYECKDITGVNEAVSDLMREFQSSLVVVNSNISVDTAKERIRLRNFDHGSRLNSVLNDNELLNLLGRQQENLNIIREYFLNTNVSYIDLDMNNDSAQNANLLMKGIMENVSKSK